MTKKQIAKQYIKHLEDGNVERIVTLFSPIGIVESPIYGIKKAEQFYLDLQEDTSNSELQIKGMFEDDETGHLALYFTYIWTLRNNQKVSFDVIDILEFDEEQKIKSLKIIYDTVLSRKLVNEMSEKE